MKSLFALIATALIGLSSQAAFMAEPYLAYDMGTGKFKGASSNADTIITAATVGGRVGYKFPVMIWTALDLSFSNGQEKWDYSDPVISDSNNTFNRTMLFADVGIDLPFFLRAWAGYALYNKHEGKSTSNYTAEGDGWKIGAGLTSLPLVSINLEYTVYNYTKIDRSGTSLSGFSNDQSSISVGVSLPLSF